MLYNKKLGNYKKYYNISFSNLFKTYNLFNSNLYDKNMNYCVMTYPILYKKIVFFSFSCKILKKRKIKKQFNINQTVILEGFISRNKCFLSIPVFSLLNNIKAY